MEWTEKFRDKCIGRRYGCMGDNKEEYYVGSELLSGFQLNLISKLQTDALQVTEQILPFFQPSFSLTIDLVSSIGGKKRCSNDT